MKKILIPAAAALMLTACFEDSVSNSYDEAKSKGNITLSVMDADDNTPVVEASVRTQFSEDAKETDESGYVVFKDNDIGSYIFEVSKDGYSTVRAYVSVEETGANDVSRVPDVVQTVTMYKAGVTISGSVYYRDAETGNLIPADSVDVVLSYTTAAIFPSEVKGKTDKNGEYTFEDVAEKVQFKVEVLQTTIGKKLYSPIDNGVSAEGLRTGSVKEMDMLVLARDTKVPSFLSSNLNGLDTDDNVELTFSTDLDEDSLLNNWSVKRNGSTVLTIQSLSKDKKTISIEPASGSWSEGASYTISGTAYSVEGGKASYSEVFSIGSVSVPKQVSSLKVAADSTELQDYMDLYSYDEDDLEDLTDYTKLSRISLMLTWKAPTSEVDSYEIFYKTDDSSDYVLYTSVTTTSYSCTLYDLPTTISSAKKVSFIVLPKNKAGVADPDGATSVSWTVDL